MNPITIVFVVRELAFQWSDELQPYIEINRQERVSKHQNQFRLFILQRFQ